VEWLGYVRRSDGDISKNVPTEQTNKKRPLGRPRTGWRDTVEKDIRPVHRGM